jgi:ubiquinone/menaquinone biosynthesis C-methylase UbiE
MDSPYQCVCCGSPAMTARGESIDCRGCGRKYPVVFGVPLLLKNVAVRPSGYRLPDELACRICDFLKLPPAPENVARLRDILAHEYEIGDFALTAENNYFLNRLEHVEGEKRSPVKNAFAHLHVNLDVRYRFEHHYIPGHLPADEAVTWNARLVNVGDSIISSKGDFPVRISYHWWEDGRLIEKDGIRTALPIDLLPGRAITVPVTLKTPAAAGRYTLELTLVREGVSWLDGQGVAVPVEVGPGADLAVPDHWVQTGQEATDYDQDHRVGREMIVAEVERRRGRGDLRVLEIGGCCCPQIEVLTCDVYSIDIDAQTLQVGHLLRERGYSHAHFVCADGNDLPFADGSFDGVVMFAALHHFPRPAAVLRGLRRLLRPGGFVATMCEPIGHYLNGVVDERFVRELEQGINEQTFSIQEYRQIFEQAGLHAARVVADVGSFKAILEEAPASVARADRSARPQALAG